MNAPTTPAMLPTMDELARRDFLERALPRMRFLNLNLSPKNHAVRGSEHRDWLFIDDYASYADAALMAEIKHQEREDGDTNKEYVCTIELRDDGTYRVLDLSGAQL